MSDEALAALLAVVEAVQRGLLQVLSAVGLAGEVHGQPAWPFGQRIATEVLAIDRALARSLMWTAVALVAALGLLAAAAVWRTRRMPLVIAALLALLAAPWPDPRLLMAPAVPTSFHRSPSGYTAASIVDGGAVFQQHCATCHGADATGEGERAATLPMWPPDLTGSLLWRRREGELLWTLLHGRHDHRGRPTMPGLAGTIDEAQAWSVLDHLQANAAGQNLRRLGSWPQPVALPDAPVRCDDGRVRPLRAWGGQRLRIVAAGPEPVAEDPRFVTIALTGSRAAVGAQCRAEGDAAWAAFARIAGVPASELSGTQFIADRRGWLRARAPAGQAGWTDADFLCRADSATSAAAAPLGVDRLIARMDAEPVRTHALRAALGSR